MTYDFFAKKAHYQMLKMECVKVALEVLPFEGEEEALGLAKKLFRSITEESWSSEAKVE